MLFDNILVNSAVGVSQVPLILSLLLSILNLLKKFLIRLIQLIRIFLIEVLFLIHHSVINGIYELVLRNLEAIFQTERIFIIIPIQGHLRSSWIILILVRSFRELDLHRVTYASSRIMLTIRMIKVSPVNDISDVRRIIDPRVLLLHNLMERIREILIDVLGWINYSVQSWIHFHDWIIFWFGNIFDLVDVLDVYPVLWVISEEPGIVVFDVQRWLIYQV